MIILVDSLYSKTPLPVDTGRAAARKILCLSMLLALFAVSVQSAQAEDAPFIAEQCEPLLEDRATNADIPYAQGLLWRISKGGKASHLFGTMHVSDTEITTLPAPVERALNESERFVMEALPEPGQVYDMMFFADGDQLSNHVAAPIFERTKEILGV